MSSQENSHNKAGVNETRNNSFINGEENIPRPPNLVTESRVLSRLGLLRNDGSQSGGGDTRAGLSNLPAVGNQPSQMIPSQTSQQPLTLPEVRSLLNAEAKVFVPRSETQRVYPRQDYSQENEFNLFARDAQFGPHDLDYYNYTGPSYSNVPYEDFEQDPGYLLENFNALTVDDRFNPIYAHEVPSLSRDSSILDQFNQALRVLNMHPANMEEYLRPICKLICNSSDPEIVNGLVESLFNQSIQEANFRYTGARIFQFLNTNLKGIQQFSDFHKTFFRRCQQDYNRRDELKKGNKEDQDKLRALAIFMAEIFLNAETVLTDGTVQRIHFLPRILIDFMQTLLSTPSDLDVKCSCQLLKLSGGLIEDVVKNTPEQCVTFEEIFAQLQSLESSSELTENTKIVIGTVIKLRKSDWNRSQSTPSKKSVCSSPLEPNNFQALDPVFYNQKGTPCSRKEAGFSEEDFEDGAYVLNEEEEEAFLTWQVEQHRMIEQGALVINDSGYDSYRLDACVDEEGMGDEMEDAYEEFLQKQNYMQSYQTHGTGPQEHQISTPVPQTFNHPPPNMTQRQEFNGYQQQQHILPPSNQQQNQVPRHRQDQQQQYQMQQYHPDQHEPYTNNDRYHYHH